MVRTENIDCNLCGCSEFITLYQGYDRLHGYEGKFTYVQCSECYLVYMNPQIVFEDLHQYYPQDYAPHVVKASRKKNVKSTKRLFLPPSVLHQLTSTSRVLDIGCGSGTFLHQLNQLTGCEVRGLDISQKAVETAQSVYGLTVDRGTIIHADYSDSSFDLITAWHYLEHVNDPMAVLKKIAALLKPEGYFALMVPNISCVNAKLFGSAWFPLDCPRHLFLYSPSVMKDYLYKSGLHVSRIRFTGSSKHLLRSLQYLRYGNNYDPVSHDKIAKSRFLRVFASMLMQCFKLTRVADIMMVIARKDG